MKFLLSIALLIAVASWQLRGWRSGKWPPAPSGSTDHGFNATIGAIRWPADKNPGRGARSFDGRGFYPGAVTRRIRTSRSGRDQELFSQPAFCHRVSQEQECAGPFLFSARHCALITAPQLHGYRQAAACPSCPRTEIIVRSLAAVIPTAGIIII